MAGLLSTVTVTTVGLACKAFIKLGFCSATVNGLPILLEALEQRHKGQGVVTIGNHISTLDDPLAWGVLPTTYYLNSRKTRWALGASDIMFTNPLTESVLSAFFRQGQTLETFRGKGIYQPAVDVAIEKLNQGGWVHLFGEGKINQPHHYPQNNGTGYLPRFKWGVGRILMETTVPPVIIPTWLTGFDKMMPEGRRFPYNFLPRLGVNISITFGDPLPLEDIKTTLGTIVAKQIYNDQTSSPDVMATWCRKEIDENTGWVACNKMAEQVTRGQTIDKDASRVRSEVTAIVQRAVEALGRKVSGDMLRNG